MKHLKKFEKFTAFGYDVDIQKKSKKEEAERVQDLFQQQIFNLKDMGYNFLSDTEKVYNIKSGKEKTAFDPFRTLWLDVTIDDLSGNIRLYPDFNNGLVKVWITVFDPNKIEKDIDKKELKITENLASELKKLIDSKGEVKI